MSGWRVPLYRIYVPERAIRRVVEVLRCGQPPQGRVVSEFEEALKRYTGAREVVCLNSCTAGLMLALWWWGVGKGDEVIVPAYTYCATANAVLHTGATPVIVDVREQDMTIDPQKVEEALTPRTKAIIAVDVLGMPCKYQELREVITGPTAIEQFRPANMRQRLLGRPLLIADAAQSFGARYRGKHACTQADFAAFSFHIAKNLTTMEGGALVICLPEVFDAGAVKEELRRAALHGQLTGNTEKGEGALYRYDVLKPGFKCNMPDILAAIGVETLSVFEEKILKPRERIFDLYTTLLNHYQWAHPPHYRDHERKSSCNIYALRIKGIHSTVRDNIIRECARKGIQLSAHFRPLPLLSAYTQLPCAGSCRTALACFESQISLPVYPAMRTREVELVVNTLAACTEKYIQAD